MTINKVLLTTPSWLFPPFAHLSLMCVFFYSAYHLEKPQRNWLNEDRECRSLMGGGKKKPTTNKPTTNLLSIIQVTMGKKSRDIQWGIIWHDYTKTISITHYRHGNLTAKRKLIILLVKGFSSKCSKVSIHVLDCQSSVLFCKM